MRLTVQREDLYHAMETLKKIVPVDDTTKVYLTVEENVGAVSINVHTFGAKCTFPVQETEEGNVLLFAKSFYTILSTLPDELVTIETLSETCVLHSKNTKTTFPLYPSDTYTPVLSLPDDAVSVLQFDAYTFKSLIDDTAFAADVRGEREFLTCLYIQPIQQYGVEMVATDTIRMAHRVFHQSHMLSSHLLIPASTLKNLAASIKNDDPLVQCYLSFHGVTFVCGKVQCVIQTLDGLYPMFHNVYPTSYTFSRVFETKPVIDALERIEVFSKKVGFDCHEQETIIHALDGIDGQSSTTIPALTVASLPVPLRIPLTPLLSILKNIRTTTFTLQTDPLGPRKTIVFSPDDNRVRYSVMPLG